MVEVRKRKRVYAICIGALFALLAFMLVIVSMNIFGHRDKLSPVTPPQQPPQTSAMPRENSIEQATSIIETSTVGAACTLKDLPLRDAELQVLANNRNLRTLNLIHCSFPGKSSAKLTAETIHVSSSDLDANAVGFIALSPCIKCAEFFSCNFQPGSLASLRSSKISWLQIRNSKVLSTDNSFSAADIDDISSMPRLVHLELERSQIAANTLGRINKSSAHVVNLRDCDLSDTDLASIALSPRLRYINVLSNTKLSIAGVRKLVQAPNIQHIKCDLDLSKFVLSHHERQKLDSSSYHVPASFYEK